MIINSFSNILVYVLYFLCPLLIRAFTFKKNKFFFDFIVILGIWIPFELNLLPFFKLLGIPSGIILGIILIIILIILCFYNPYSLVNRIQFRFFFTKKEWIYVFAGLVWLICLLIPVGCYINFLNFRGSQLEQQWSQILSLKYLIGIYFYALAEELLFRGVILNLFNIYFSPSWKIIKGININILFSSFIFGLAHVNNLSFNHTLPNWSYVFMSSIAGIGYSWVWQKTQNLAASTVLHFLINIIWHFLFF